MGVTVNVPATPWQEGTPRIPEELARAIWNAAGQRRVADRRDAGSPIPEGQRDNALASLAGSMRRRGMGFAAISAALHQVNEEQCIPPLDDGDVRRIAQSVCRYEADDPVVKQFEKGERDPVYDEEGHLQHRFDVLPIADLYAKEEPGYQPLLGPFVMRGLRTLIGARTGEGKSTFVMHMVKAIVHGEEFLGYEGIGANDDGEAPQVLIIDAEQSLPDIQRLAEECDLTESRDVHYIMAPDGLDLAEGTHDAAEIEQILEELRPDILVLDPLYKSHRGDSNDEREAVDFMRLLDRWRSEYGFALILPVHTRKGSKQTPDAAPTMDDIFGSGAFARGAEIIFGLQQKSPGFSRLHVWKHRPGWLHRDIIDMVFKREEGFRRAAVEELKHTVEQQIVEILRTKGRGMTAEEIVMELGQGRSVQSVRRAVSKSGIILSAPDPENRKRVRYFIEPPAMELPEMPPEDKQLSEWEDMARG